ncbi:glycosyltransferase family 39 protein [Thermococcus sp. MV11]|uniref:glycosyltransferase family 39 protein n=1 Tax=Thermococcus sp. MV11 TaxID=1638267 RepID=UPI0014320357|nr:glycosyltransferase family 39 protein [Thermococcus sp. MV11]NJE03267.1 phospholipid carrier-dependent glycosyltransferase [Thermococcus sp. MV11]
MKREALERLIPGLILLVYILTRVTLLFQMNEYVDYDEGTYLLMARLINSGYLPYRDIFAVHPPLYYYLLAGWLRVFGDSYVSGRLLSVFLGGLAVVLAYRTGKLLGGTRLAVLYSALLLVDPTVFRINQLVLHDTLIELFVIASLYYFVRYTKNKSLRDMYVSLFLAGLGSTAKFTILPFVVALYITFLALNLDETSKMHFQSAVNLVLSWRQGLVIAAVYSFLIALFVSLRMAWPSSITKDIIVVLGIHPVVLVGHKYVGVFIFLMWAILVVYLFRVEYFEKLVHIFRSAISQLRLLICMALAVLIPKVIVEGALGYLISGDYFYQTYLMQGGRYGSFMGLYELINRVLSTVGSNHQETAYVFVPAFLLIFALILFRFRGFSNEKPLPVDLAVLFVMNVAMYLLVFPVRPITRFILPLLLTFYLFAGERLAGYRVFWKEWVIVGAVSLVSLIMIVGGLVINAPSGELGIPWAVHSGELRSDAISYMKTSSSCGSMYSVNPMNTYYFNAETNPLLVDSFGVLYVNGTPVEEFFKQVKVSSDCVVFSTWAEGAIRSGGHLGEIYSQLKALIVTNGELLFSESYSTGDVLSIFSLRTPPRSPTVISENGRIVILDDNGSAVMSIYGLGDNVSLSSRAWITRITLGVFSVRLYSENPGEYIELTVRSVSRGLLLSSPNTTTKLVLEYEGVATDTRGNLLDSEKRYGEVIVYSGHHRFRISAEGIHQKRGGTIILDPGTDIEVILED